MSVLSGFQVTTDRDPPQHFVRSLIAMLIFMMSLEAQAQVTTTLIPTAETGTLGTHVTSPANHIHNITGGTPVGSNLFHSFDQFNVGSGEIANFQNVKVNGTFPHFENILTRVVGGEPSLIYGTLRTTDFGNASLFLLNPSGIIFGPTASLDIGAASQGPRGSGSFYATTADYLKIGDGPSPSRFYADAVQSSILTSHPVSAFGFLGQTASIVVDGSQLSVPDGQTLALTAGEIRIDAAETTQGVRHSAMLSASSGRVDIASITAGEISATIFQPSINGQLGPVSIENGSVISVSNNAGAAGTVRIRAGQLILDNATISADTGIKHSAPVAVDILAADEFSITATTNSVITAKSTGSGDAGAVEIVSGKMTVSATNPNSLTVIDTHTSGGGRAGNISIIATDITVTGDSDGITRFIDSGTTGANSGGNVSIEASNVTFESAYIDTGDSTFQNTSALGSAGNIKIIGTNKINLSFSNLTAESSFGNAGDILLASQGNIGLEFSGVGASGFGRSGAIEIRGDQVSMLDSHVEGFLRGGPLGVAGGQVVLTGRTIALTEGSTITTTTLGNGDAGAIHVSAEEQLNLVGTSAAISTGIFSNSIGLNGGHGSGGNVFINTPRLEITGGARINTATRTSGPAGNVIIDAGSISMSGQLADPPSEGIFGLGNQLASGVFTSTVDSLPTLCLETCGNAGNISISTDSLHMSSGAHINSGTSSSGHGGTIDIRSTNTINLSGTLTDGSPVGIFSRSISISPDAGAGGNISLTAGRSISVRNGATVSASSAGPENAGNISINAGRQFDVRNGSITTQAAQASGGNIDIRAIDRVRLINGEISSSVQGGPNTAGGNITIDPNIVVLQGHSKVTAQAVQGAGGNITIFTPLFLSDPTSLVSASSQFGLSGTVNIQSPTSNLSGTVKQLPSKPSETQALLQNRCAALAGGEQSTFILAGRDILPAEPGGWLSSPLVMGNGVENGHEDLSRLTGKHMVEGKILSLRRLMPPGFLVRTFAIDGTTGCHS